MLHPLRSLAFAAAVLALVAGLTASTARATSTRAEYVAQVDPICHSSTIQVRQTLRRHHLPAVLFIEDLRSGSRKAQLRFAKILEVTVGLDRLFVSQIAAVAPPPGDEVTIGRWVADLRVYAATEIKVIHAIRAGKGRRAYRLMVRAVRPLIEDNEALKPFGFQDCTF